MSQIKYPGIMMKNTTKARNRNHSRISSLLSPFWIIGFTVFTVFTKMCLAYILQNQNANVKSQN